MTSLVEIKETQERIGGYVTKRLRGCNNAIGQLKYIASSWHGNRLRSRYNHAMTLDERMIERAVLEVVKDFSNDSWFIIAVADKIAKHDAKRNES